MVLLSAIRGSQQSSRTTYVWGTQYIDELLQVGINEDPSDEGNKNCDAFYYAAQDANYNVIGLFDDNGDLIERYEYPSRPDPSGLGASALRSAHGVHEWRLQ